MILATLIHEGLPALRIAGTFFFIINLLAGAYVCRNRHRWFDRDPSVYQDVPAVRNLRVEVIVGPWLVLTTCLLAILITLWIS